MTGKICNSYNGENVRLRRGGRKMVEEKFTIKNSDGKKIAGKIFAPQIDGKKYPTVIISHGFNSCYADLEHHGAGYANEGIVAIFFDFCGGGYNTLSDGTLTEMTPITEANDLLAVIEYASNSDYVDTDNLFLLGESQGGFESAYVAAQIPDKIKGLILWYPAFVIPEQSKERYKTNDNTCFGIPISPEFNEVAKDIDINDLMDKYRGPVLLTHGDADEIVPLSYSEHAQQRYTNASLKVIPKAGHGYEGEDSENARKLSISFIKKNTP